MLLFIRALEAVLEIVEIPILAPLFEVVKLVPKIIVVSVPGRQGGFSAR